MLKIKPSELKNIAITHYKNQVPLFVYGGFGIGKSAIMRQVAKHIAAQKKKEFIDWGKISKEKKLEILKNPEKYLSLIDIRLSQFEPSDLKGLPRFDSNNYLEWSIPMWLSYLTKEKTDAVLFFDEMNLAPPSVLASCYQIFHDREVNEQKIADDVFIVGAGNRLEDMAHVQDMPAPLRDRKSEVELILDTDEWFDWAFKNSINENILAFLKFREDYVLKVTRDRDEKSITPRGWERTSKLMNSTKESDWKQLISGSVGEGVASELVAFIKLQKNANLDEILNHPKSVKDIDGVDLKYSVIAGISQKYKQNKAKTFKKVLNVAANFEPEYGILLLKMAKSSGEDYFKKNVIKEKVWKQTLAKEYGKYLL